MNTYLTQGKRQNSIDVWISNEPPELVRGDWRRGRYVGIRKKFALPDATLPRKVCEALGVVVPEDKETFVRVR